MDIQTLQARTGLSARRIRYVIDHEIVPNLVVNVERNTQGKPRVFSEDMAIGIACAAILLDVGLSRETVRYVIENLAKIPWNLDRGKSSMIVNLLLSNFPATLQLGDGVYLRLFSGSYVDSGWVDPKTLKRLKGYEPRIVVELDLGQIRDQVYGHRKAP